MRRNMAASLFQHGAIRTTEAKAKELRRFAEKLITLAKKGTLHARRRAMSLMRDRLMADDDGELITHTNERGREAFQTVLQKLDAVAYPVEPVGERREGARDPRVG